MSGSSCRTAAKGLRDGHLLVTGLCDGLSGILLDIVREALGDDLGFLW